MRRPPLHSCVSVSPLSSLARGFTAVEIMLSIAVLGIGAAGVMSMQSASIQGNADAHMLDMGNSIAREWIERLRRDAMTWTEPEPNANPPLTTGTWQQTLLVSQIGANSAVGSYVYPAVPASAGFNVGNVADPGFGNMFDILGRDLIQPAPAGQSAPVFCSQLRGDWLVPDQLIRAQVRVYWMRQLYTAPAGAFCTAAENVDATGAQNANLVYHFVYAATALARNAAAQ